MTAPWRLFVLAALLLSAGAAAAAPHDGGHPGEPGCPGDLGMIGGPPHHRGGGPGGPLFRDYLFPPELILRNQERLSISAEQIEGLKRLINETHRQMTDLQVELEQCTERLRRILDAQRIDEAAALPEVERIMGFETQVKRAQIALLIRAKNLLTAEQQEMLEKIRAEERPERGSRGEQWEPMR